MNREYELALIKAKLHSATKGMEIDLCKPGKTCKACGKPFDEDEGVESYVIWPGVTLCPSCFFEGLKGGENC